MVLCQWEAYYLAGEDLPIGLVCITLAGTMAIYGTDHWAERGFQKHLSHRHYSHKLLDLLIIAAVASLGIAGLVHWSDFGVSWILILGLSGGAYLLTTWGKWFYLPGFKEILGAWCFTFLVWGTLDRKIDGLQVAFFSMGIANFLHSSYQDRHRDHANDLHAA